MSILESSRGPLKSTYSQPHTSGRVWRRVVCNASAKVRHSEKAMRSRNVSHTIAAARV